MNNKPFQFKYNKLNIISYKNASITIRIKFLVWKVHYGSSINIYLSSIVNSYKLFFMLNSFKNIFTLMDYPQLLRNR